MRLICGECERKVWLRSDDLEGVDIDGENDLVCPFCRTRALTAAVEEEERQRRQGRSEHGVYE